MPTGPGQHNTEQDVIIPRILAFLVDYIVSLALVIVFMIALLVSGTPWSPVLFISSGVLILLCYHIIPEGLWGQTPGKALWVIVVSHDGTPVTMKAAAVRNLLRIIDAIGNYVLGLIVMLITDRNQRVGDLAAGTVVLKKR